MANKDYQYKFLHTQGTYKLFNLLCIKLVNPNYFTAFNEFMMILYYVFYRQFRHPWRELPA